MSTIKQTLLKHSLLTQRRRAFIFITVVILVVAGALTGLQAFMRSAHALDEWTETSINSPSSRFYNLIAQSSDGSKAVASAVGNNGHGNLFTTSDGGATWTERPNAGNRDWRALAMSSDGTHVVAGSNYGFIYTSSDGGATWTERQSSGEYSWSFVAISADGSHIVAAPTTGYLSMSDDGGATWARHTELGNTQWTGLAISGDGQEVAASALAYYDEQSAYIQESNSYQSVDGGSTWQSINDLGSGQWFGVAITSDGTTAMINNVDSIFVSHDGMQTWQAEKDIQSLNASYGTLQISDDASTILITAGSYKHLSTDGGDTWQLLVITDIPYTTVFLARNGESLKSVGLYQGPIGYSSDLGQTWNVVYPTGVRYWRDVTETDDGLHLAAVADGYIYTSDNGGSSWNERTGAGSHEWGFVSYAGDGSVLIAGVGGVYDSGFAYLSQDHGATWQEVDENVAGQFSAGAVSEDGSTIIIGTHDNQLFRSKNAGVDWEQLTTPNMFNLQSIALSNNGQYVIAASTNHNMAVSSNSGDTWTEQTAAGARQWESVAMSGDGHKIVALETNRKIYISNDYGVTFTMQSNSQESVSYKDVAMSDDGSKIIAVTALGAIYSSLDGGTTWDARTNTPDLLWRAVAVDGAGEQATAVGYSSNIWKGALRIQKAPATIPSLTVDTVASHSFHVSWAAQPGDVPVDTYDLQYRVKGTSSWISAPSIPGTQLSYTLTGLQPQTHYEIRMRATNGLGSSSWLSGTYSSHGLPFTFSVPTPPSDIASSANGATILAASDDTHLYISHNSGADWTQLAGITSAGWMSVGMSADAAKMVAATADTQQLYVSTNGGADWTASTAAGTDQWISVVYSSDGNAIYAIGFASGLIKSTDDGASWTTVKSNEAGTFNYSVSVAPNGTLYLVVIDFSGPSLLLRSDDDGATWTQVYSNADTYNFWVGAGGANAETVYVATSPDGTSIDPTLKKSDDGGQTWSDVTINGDAPLAVSGDGTKLFYVFNQSLITYQSSISITTLAAGEEPSDNETPIVVTLPGSENNVGNSGSPSSSSSTQTTTSNTVLSIKIGDTPASETKKIPKRPTFSGYAAPFANVVVTVHSVPKECRTTADATGYWECTLSEDLEPGNHTVRISVVNTDGSIQEAGPYDVSVEGATDDNPTNPVAQTGTIETKTQGWPLLWYVIAGIVGLVLVILIANAIAKRRK